MKIENERLKLNELDGELKELMSVPSYQIGLYTFDVHNRKLMLNGDSVKLTVKESYLLVMFAANVNKLLERKRILTTIWKDETFYNSRSLDVYICKIRKLLSKDPNIMFTNVHGKGYRIFTS